MFSYDLFLDKAWNFLNDPFKFMQIICITWRYNGLLRIILLDTWNYIFIGKQMIIIK